MKMFEVEIELGDELVIGGLSVFPLTGASETGPAYLTGPEAFEAGLIQVSELDPPEVPSLAIGTRTRCAGKAFGRRSDPGD